MAVFIYLNSFSIILIIIIYRDCLAFATEPVFASLSNILGKHHNFSNGLPSGLKVRYHDDLNKVFLYLYPMINMHTNIYDSLSSKLLNKFKTVINTKLLF